MSSTDARPLDGFFGELYLRSTRPFLSARGSDGEAAFLRSRLPVDGPVLDLGCGHGRHLERLGELPVLGVDRDGLSLREARQAAPVARGDFAALPFRSQSLAAVYVWYNTLGTFEPEEAQVMLREVARCLRPGGRFMAQGSHPQRAVEHPLSEYDGALPDGSHLLERCVWDAAGRRDRLTRRLTLPDGRVMAADFFIRYYDADEWRARLEDAGLELEWVCGGVDGSPATTASAELIVGARKRV